MKIGLFRALKYALAYRLAAALRFPPRPRKLRLALTNRCNARCRTCNAWKMEGNEANELTLEEYEKLLTLNRRFLPSAYKQRLLRVR